MGMGFPDEGDVWCRIEMGEEGIPQGVDGLRVATWVKSGRVCRPVPPITAMRMVPGSKLKLYRVMVVED